jgi:peroxiredoxin
MLRVLKILAVMALVAVLVAGLTTSVCCDNNGNSNGSPNGGTPNGEVPNGNETNGFVPAGNNPDNLDLSQPGLIVEREDRTAANAKAGDSLPDFTFQDANGQLFSLSDFKGKAVMLNFWRVSCHWCVVEMPYIQEVYDDWTDDNVVILTINVGDSAEEVAAFFEENGLSLPVLLDEQAELAINYLVNSFPLSFFIDKDGSFQGVWPGALSSAQELRDILDWLTSF